MDEIDFKPYTDAWEHLCTAHPSGILDGGDSSHKGSHVALAYYLAGDATTGSTHLDRTNGIGLRRHPDSSKWYSNPRTFSRDQFSPRVISNILYGNTKALKEYFRAHLKRLCLFAWNTRPSWNEKLNPSWLLRIIQFILRKDKNWKVPDITSLFEFWGFYIRGFRCWLLYPWLILSDLETVISAAIKRFDSDTDVNNCLAACILAKNVMPTGLGHIAYWILKPVLKRKLEAYWDAARYEPPIGKLYIKALGL